MDSRDISTTQGHPRSSRKPSKTLAFERRLRDNLRAAKRRNANNLTHSSIERLKSLIQHFGFSVEGGELQIIDGSWYVRTLGCCAWPVAEDVAVSTSKPLIRCASPSPADSC